MKTLTKPCLQCGKKFKKHWAKSLKQWNERTKFCSIACRGKYVTNQLSWRQKQSESHKGKKLSAKTRKKMSVAQSMEKHAQWKGGKPKCEVCKKLLASYGAKRCRHHALWKGREKPKCLICQKVLTNYGTKHCKQHQPPNNWKGDKASYYAVHAWVARHRGRPQKCEHCGTTEKKKYQWANKSHEYKRDLNDWIRLCVPCHKKYDNR